MRRISEPYYRTLFRSVVRGNPLNGDRSRHVKKGGPRKGRPARSAPVESLHNIVVATVKSAMPVQRIGPCGHTLCGLPLCGVFLVLVIMPGSSGGASLAGDPLKDGRFCSVRCK